MITLALTALLLSPPALAGEEEGRAPTRGDTLRITPSLVEQVLGHLKERVRTESEGVEAALRQVDQNEDGLLQPKEYEEAFITIGNERFRCPEALFGFHKE